MISIKVTLLISLIRYITLLTMKIATISGKKRNFFVGEKTNNFHFFFFFARASYNFFGQFKSINSDSINKLSKQISKWSQTRMGNNSTFWIDN